MGVIVKKRVFCCLKYQVARDEFAWKAKKTSVAPTALKSYLAEFWQMMDEELQVITEGDTNKFRKVKPMNGWVLP